MDRRTTLFAALAATLLPLAARAEPAAPKLAEAPPAASPPAAPPRPKLDTAGDPGFDHKAPRRLGDKVALQLEDADLSDLAKVIGELTGERYLITSPKLAKVKATVYAAQKVTVAEARQAFLAMLAANGLTVIPQAGFYKIIESQDVSRQLTPIERGELPRDERYVTRIHRLAHLSAEDVAASVLSKLATKDASIVPYSPSNVLIITETAANLRRMLEVLSAIDEAGEEDKLWLQPLMHVASSQVDRQLREILGLDKRAADPVAGTLHVGRIVAIDRPNALAIVATKASYERIVEVLGRIDVAPTSESQVHVIMLQHSEAKKIVGPLNEALGASAQGGRSATPNAQAAVLDAPVKVAADETTNALIVTAGARDFAQVKAVIDALDRAKRQVYIEAVVLDVSSERGLDVGSALHGGDVNPSLFGPTTAQQTVFGGFRPLTSAAPGTGDLQAFALGVRGPTIPFANVIPGVSQIPSFGALLTAVAHSGSSDILSTPHILASDNTKAEIRVQLNTSLQPNAPQSSIIGSVAAAAGASSGLMLPTTSSVSNNYKPIGPKIAITPHLNESDEVRIDVEELISDVQSQPDRGDTYGTVTYLERAATTTFTVKNGETAVIGGLVRSRAARSETKVPILGDIPLIGILFRTRADHVEKSNLMLILTPHIIRDQSDLRAIFQRKMDERQELVDREAIFGEGAKWSPPHDWRKTHGLLGDVRLAQRDVDRRRREAVELAPRGIEATRSAPLELPVPQAAARGDKPQAPPPSPSRPTLVEK